MMRPNVRCSAPVLGLLLLTSACAGDDGAPGAAAVASGQVIADTSTTTSTATDPADTIAAEADRAAEADPGEAETDDTTGPGDGVGADTTTTGAAPDPTVGAVKPDWLGSRPLPTLPDGAVVPQTTPDELVDRRFPTDDTLPPPTDATFTATIAALAGEPLERSTWSEECPVGVDELAYLVVSFWGFDGLAHQGELIVNASVADDMVSIFETLFEARFPIEEMRIVTPADLDAPPTGDGNNTAAFVCRAVTGGSSFSQHAYGLAIDINPFHNPYQRGSLVLPELAGSFLDRSDAQPGMITEGDVVVAAFDAIGWGWGGRWTSLKDYQHFSHNNR